MSGVQMDAGFTLPRALDYLATFTWATTGAAVGLRKGYDLTGVFVIALLSSTGGGLVRDGMFLQRPPALLTDAVYLPLIAVTTLLVALFARAMSHPLSRETLGKLVDIIDGIGIPAFAVIGMQLAEQVGVPIVGVVFIGVVNGVAGGLLRDVVVRDVPALLRPGQFVSLTLLLACGIFQALKLWSGFTPTQAAWTTVGIFFLLRVVAVRFNWQTRSVLPGSVAT
jgi:uncharacterized membrane protein YeiH